MSFKACSPLAERNQACSGKNSIKNLWCDELLIRDQCITCRMSHGSWSGKRRNAPEATKPSLNVCSRAIASIYNTPGIPKTALENSLPNHLLRHWRPKHRLVLVG